jgi:hypothetical protein
MRYVTNGQSPVWMKVGRLYRMPDFVYPQPIYSNNSTDGKHAGKLSTGDMFLLWIVS